ncbi:MAG: hypothetical protein ABI693_31300 [Bryobacteraceae bacterium]
MASLLSTAVTGVAEDRVFALLFGPTDGSKLANAAAAAATQAGAWLQTPGTDIELRRPGTRDGQELTKHLKADVLERAVLDAARQGGEAKLKTFLDGVEFAIFALARHGGTRYLVATLETPALTDDDTARLLDITGTANSSHVKILLVDLSSAPGKQGAAAWKTLAVETGGAMVAGFAELDALIPKPELPVAAPAAGQSMTVQAARAPVAFIGYFKTAPASAKRSGSTLASGRGLLIVEAPLRNLEFATEGKNYSVRAKLTQIARRKDGEIAWQASKEVAAKGPTLKADARKAGSFYLLREVQLPAGEYTLEATVEDLNASQTGTIKEPLRALDTLPGLSMSSALFVRKLNKGSDVFEADQVLQYEGEALAPMLNPEFPANQPFELPVYFLFYPDMNGKRPELKLDILQKGQMVGGSTLAFTDNMRDDSRSGRGTLGGEQKHEYPYLAKLANALFNAGDYEVRITIRQDRWEVSSTAPFRVR